MVTLGNSNIKRFKWIQKINIFENFPVCDNILEIYIWLLGKTQFIYQYISTARGIPIRQNERKTITFFIFFRIM